MTMSIKKLLRWPFRRRKGNKAKDQAGEDKDDGSWRSSALPPIPDQAPSRKPQSNDANSPSLSASSQSTKSSSVSQESSSPAPSCVSAQSLTPPAPSKSLTTAPSLSTTTHASSITTSRMTTESSLRQTLSHLQSAPSSSSQTLSLLKSAKHNLLALNALIPQPSTPPHILALARSTLEAGALLSLRAQDADAFTRYYSQLQSFYELPASAYSASDKGAPKSGAGIEGGASGQRSKITGLYLMLLLTKNDYAGFHTVLEGLESASNPAASIHEDPFLRYPIRLEQWLMEGAYDRVWAATSSQKTAPSPEFSVFSEVLIHTIRGEIASCSEKAYASIPVASAKNLLFLESEGAVVQFAGERGWGVREGRVEFGEGAGGGEREGGEEVSSGAVIENTIGYARELETIV